MHVMVLKMRILILEAIIIFRSSKNAKIFHSNKFSGNKLNMVSTLESKAKHLHSTVRYKIIRKIIKKNGKPVFDKIYFLI